MSAGTIRGGTEVMLSLRDKFGALDKRFGWERRLALLVAAPLSFLEDFNPCNTDENVEVGDLLAFKTNFLASPTLT